MIAPTYPIALILDVVAWEAGFSVAELKVRERGTARVWARRIAAYLALEHTTHTVPTVGRALTPDDATPGSHATVLHARQAVGARLEQEPAFAERLAFLRHKLAEHAAAGTRPPVRPDPAPPTPPCRQIALILEVVAAAHGLEPQALLDRDRDRQKNEARAKAMTLARRITHFGYGRLAREFRRDHTTVLFLVRRTEDRERDDPALAAELAALEAACRERGAGG